MFCDSNPRSHIVQPRFFFIFFFIISNSAKKLDQTKSGGYIEEYQFEEQKMPSVRHGYASMMLLVLPLIYQFPVHNLNDARLRMLHFVKLVQCKNIQKFVNFCNQMQEPTQRITRIGSEPIFVLHYVAAYVNTKATQHNKDHCIIL